MIQNAVVGGTLLTTIQYFSLFIFTIVSLLLMGKMGPSLYGIWATIIGIFNLYDKITQSVFYTPFIREISIVNDDKEHLGIVFTSGVFFILSIASIEMVFIIFSYINTFKKLFNIIFLYRILLFFSIAIICNSFLYFAIGLNWSFLNYRVISILKITDISVNTLAYLLVLNKSYEYIIINLVTYFFVGRLVILTISLVFIIKFIKQNEIKIIYSSKFVKLFIKSAIIFSIGSIIKIIVIYIDALILPHFLDAIELGYYFFAKQLILTISISYGTFLTFFFPVIVKKEANKSEGDTIDSTTLLIKIVTIMIIPITILLVTFPDRIILSLSILSPNLLKYLNSSDILSILSVFLIVDSLSIPMILYFNSIKRYEKILIANLIKLITYLVSLALALSINATAFVASIIFTFAHAITFIYWLISFISFKETFLVLNIKHLLIILAKNTMILFIYIVMIYYTGLLIGDMSLKILDLSFIILSYIIGVRILSTMGILNSNEKTLIKAILKKSKILKIFEIFI